MPQNSEQVFKYLVKFHEVVIATTWLVINSAWFECTPLPDNEYEIVVKVDRTPGFSRFLESLRGY